MTGEPVPVHAKFELFCTSEICANACSVKSRTKERVYFFKGRPPQNCSIGPGLPPQHPAHGLKRNRQPAACQLECVFLPVKKAPVCLKNPAMHGVRDRCATSQQLGSDLEHYAAGVGRVARSTAHLCSSVEVAMIVHYQTCVWVGP